MKTPGQLSVQINRAGPPVVHQLWAEPLDEAPIEPCIVRDDKAFPGELGGRREVDCLARHHIRPDAGQLRHISGDRLLRLAEGGSSDPDPGYAARVLIPEGHHREFDDLVLVRIQSRGLDIEEHGPFHFPTILSGSVAGPGGIQGNATRLTERPRCEE